MMIGMTEDENVVVGLTAKDLVGMRAGEAPHIDFAVGEPKGLVLVYRDTEAELLEVLKHNGVFPPDELGPVGDGGSKVN